MRSLTHRSNPCSRSRVSDLIAVGSTVEEPFVMVCRCHPTSIDRFQPIYCSFFEVEAYSDDGNKQKREKKVQRKLCSCSVGVGDFVNNVRVCLF
jgi:hypothetical protein